MKKYITSFILASSALTLSNNAQAVDWQKFFGSMFTTAGSKAVTNDEGKNIDKFATGNCTGQNPWGQPLLKDENIMKRSLFICRAAYSMQYDSVNKIPLWISEILVKDNIINPPPAGLKYLPIQLDPDLPSGMQVKLEEYKGTGYEPAQLAPYGDLYFHLPSAKDEESLAINQSSIIEGSYASNTLPMASSLKRGLWQQLEVQIRMSINTPTRQQFYTLTGPIYFNGQNKGTIGKKGVQIPTHFYKIVVDPNTDGSLSYIIPNQDILSVGYRGTSKAPYTCGGGACSLNNFVVSMKEVERLTGFTFFPKLAPVYATKVKLDPSLINKKSESGLK